VADLTIQKRVLDFNSYGDLSLRGEVRNLFDKDYSYVKGYPMPGRSFVLGMEYSF
jgi:vitamin B12 transporter